jgi:hypothetical protein
MNQDIKAKWVAALRGGEYKQGAGQLRLRNRFCCLGVLCELHAKAVGMAWQGDVYCGSEMTLPSDVMTWADLPLNNPDVEVEGYEEATKELAVLNDEGMPFPEIADLIEKQL